MYKALLTLAFICSIAAAQPAKADEIVGQMIDDSGLVISSYSNGTIKETQLLSGDKLPLMFFEKSMESQLSSLPVLETAVLAKE